MSQVTVISLLCVYMTAGALAAQLQSGIDGYHCASEGIFSDPISCEHFVRCIAVENGKFKMERESCKGNAFSEEENRCVSPEKIPGCQIRQPRQDFTPDPVNDDVCNPADGSAAPLFACTSCSSMVTCIEGKAYAMDCATYTACKPDPTFGGAVCVADHTIPSCTCSGTNVYQKDMYNEQEFFFCGTTSVKKEYTCPDSQKFDEATKRCVNMDGSPVVQVPPCEKDGTFSVPNDCETYYDCVGIAGNKFAKHVFKCSTSQQFNEVSGACEDPCTFIGGTAFGGCTAAGRFKDPTNCQKQIVCVQDSVGTFSEFSVTCPAGTSFEEDATDPTKNRCSATATCTPEESKCIKPVTCS